MANISITNPASIIIGATVIRVELYTAFASNTAGIIVAVPPTSGTCQSLLQQRLLPSRYNSLLQTWME